MTTIYELLNQLRGRGLLADIDVAFARFVGGNADNDPSLTLLAALVSNAASMHGEIALPVRKIGTRALLRYYLENLSAGDSDDVTQDSGELPDFGFVERLSSWPPDPNAFPCLFREYRPGSGEPFQPAPLILSDGLFYLGRAFQNELFLRDYLRSRTDDSHPVESIPLETVTKLELGKEQKSAVAAAVNSRFLVISGGPGTGKTTIVSIILALRRERPSDVILCENLRDESRRAEITQIQSSTIHRLLSWNPQDGTFRYNRKNPLHYKLFIVDECSMIAQSLMVSLLKAVPDDASVILLGDRYQLSSVEPGSVFGDFCSILRASAPDCLAELNESRRFRQGGEICTMKDAINSGEAEAAWNFMTQPDREAVVSRDIPPRHALRQFLSDEIEGADAWFHKKGSAAVRYCDEDTIDAAWVRFEQFRILTPFNVGPYGANAFNRLARSILGFPDKGGPFPGETFLILQNDYGTNVFNGDTGILWFAGDDGRPLGRSESGSRANRLLVFFPDPPSEFKWRGIPPESLPQYAPAYAFTIHKSQGSDYDNILLFLPPSAADHGIVTRESVYTGLTRAKKKAVIAAGRDAFCGAVERHIDRVSGLPRLCIQDH